MPKTDKTCHGKLVQIFLIFKVFWIFEFSETNVFRIYSIDNILQKVVVIQILTSCDCFPKKTFIHVLIAFYATQYTNYLLTHKI